MLGDDPVGNIAADVRQSEIAPGIPIGQLGMIESQKVQNRGVQIVHVHTTLDGPISQFVGFTVCETSFQPATRHEDRKANLTVTTTVVFRRVTTT